MFKLNFSKILSDFSLRKEKTDMFICTWKLKNKKEYADFKKRIDRIETGDLSVLFDMYSLMKTCVPPEAQGFLYLVLRFGFSESCPNALDKCR